MKWVVIALQIAGCIVRKVLKRKLKDKKPNE